MLFLLQIPIIITIHLGFVLLIAIAIRKQRTPIPPPPILHPLLPSSIDPCYRLCIRTTKQSSSPSLLATSFPPSLSSFSFFISVMRINLFNRQPPFLDFHGDHYRIWTIYNKDVTSGSYYAIWPNGEVNLITVLNHHPTAFVTMQSAVDMVQKL